MNRLLKSLILTAVIAAGISSCTDDTTPQPAADADSSPAGEQGMADAKALVDAQFATERDLHSALLAVKSREWKMRQQGDSIGATAYVNAFRRYLEDTDSELADKIF